ncbi:multiheme c-type cytochrome [Ferrimonas marina]|nr:hypothetical protein [Ferrimonas marina]
MNKSKVGWLVASALAIGLAGCADDGKDGSGGAAGPEGPQGPDGNPGSPVATVADKLDFSILETGINDKGQLVATVKVTNEQGLAVIKMPDMYYVTGQMTAEGERGQRQMFERGNCNVDCLEEIGDGTYTLTAPGILADFEHYQAEAAKLFYVMDFKKGTGIEIPQLGSFNGTGGAAHYFMEDGSEVALQKAMVATESCHSCHTDIAHTHSMPAYTGVHFNDDLTSCLVCHADEGANSKGVISERIHRWHTGLPKGYVTPGYDCTACHVSEATEALPQGADWLATSTDDRACLSCHTESHQIDNCASCHDVASKHLSPLAAKEKARNSYSFKVVEASWTPTTDSRGLYAWVKDSDGKPAYFDKDGNPWVSDDKYYMRDNGEITRADHLYNTAEVRFTVEILDAEGKPVAEAPKSGDIFQHARVTLTYGMENDYVHLTRDAYIDHAENRPNGRLSRRGNHTVSFNYLGKTPVAEDKAKGLYTYVISGEFDRGESKVVGGDDYIIQSGGATGLVIPTGMEGQSALIATEAVMYYDPQTGAPTVGGDHVERQISHYTFFNQDGLLEQQDWRRQVVSNDNCASCHGERVYGYHGRRNDLEQQCQACHFPSNTEWDGVHMDNVFAPQDPVQDHISWNIYVHALHAQKREEQQADGVSWPGLADGSVAAGSKDAYRVFTYPARLSDCAQCHVAGSVRLDLVERISPVLTRKDYAMGDDFDPATPIPVYATSPASATCWSCHGGADKEGVKAHMELNGGVFELLLDDTNSTWDGDAIVDIAFPTREACSACHTPTKLEAAHAF